MMIKQATLEDTNVIEEIFADAIDWMQKNNIGNMWTKESTRWEKISSQYKISDFYIAYIENEPVGCVALTDYDHTYWPQIAKGEAMYVHKLAVKRKAAGQGVSKKMITFAKNLAIQMGYKDIRLDCKFDRNKLRKLYEKFGFQYVGDVKTKNEYRLALYICKLTT